MLVFAKYPLSATELRRKNIMIIGFVNAVERVAHDDNFFDTAEAMQKPIKITVISPNVLPGINAAIEDNG